MPVLSLVHRVITAIALASAALLAPSARAQLLPLDARLNEQVIMVPAGPRMNVSLETTLYKPAGPGPFPLLIINHGKSPGSPRAQQRDRFVYMATQFVRRGYAVMVPMRTGFAHSGGTYADFGCNMKANGYQQAGDIADVVTYARDLPYIDADHIVIAGQSYGGLASIALSTQDLPGVRGIMNFAGGLKVHGNACDWQGSLVSAFAEFGRKNRVETLWMYGANDSYFGPALVNRMYDAFSANGGKVQLVSYGPFKHDAHTMLGSRDGQSVWLPEVERFLRQVGMPTDQVYAVAEPAPQPASNYAALADIAAVPFLPEKGRQQYKDFLTKQTPRAFAVSSSGAWGWAEEGEMPNERALAACQAASREPCRLYSVDDYVVWTDSAEPPKDTMTGGTN
ncbi:dienelactone hydrolase [Pseudoduganella lurida]|uniref:Dienelactone hydrolase n=1 Tax=Pseudoduganella lurida TaxID=1036180 RepID=A0A562RH30_9BURK|nr:CocE/NonD family hydrolase [Pseudoduganella lurida]TWI67670.1 dienelactone hydrolase [Pseudoduganella lurida]